MTLPFEFSHQGGLLVALLIGLGFGFVLERAGFGRSTKLAAQFYLRDMTVFKVMFSAIVTAMLGLVAASGFGLVDLRAISESIASWTWIWPMVAGGFVLGVGFIVSGYCPGTSVVAAASGNVDGMLTVAGVVAGTWIYTQLQRIPQVAAFHDSGAREAWFLYDIVEVPPQLIAIAFALMAVAAFAGAEKVEALMAGRARAERPRTWLRYAAPAFGTLAAAAALTIALSATSPAAASSSTSAQPIAAADLAKQYAAEPWRFVIEGATAIDLRTNRVLAIAGGAAAWKADPLVTAMTTGVAAPAPSAARPRGVVAKPKKKGGGCSA